MSAAVATLPPKQLDERTVTLEAIDALSSALRSGKGGPMIAAVIAGILAGVVSSLSLWGLHDKLGGAEENRRLDAVEDRIESIEREQTWNRWALTSIAKAVGAELPPELTASK